METPIILGFAFTIIFFLITYYNFTYYILNRIRISKFIENLENGKTESLFIFTFGNPLDIFRMFERVQPSIEITDQNLTKYLLKNSTLKKRMRNYGIITSFVFIMTLILATIK